jgi:ATP-dependent RNA helicase DeaD
MGKDGIAYTFVCPDQGDPLTSIELLINKTIPTLPLDDFVAYRRERKEPAARELWNTTKSRTFARS